MKKREKKSFEVLTNEELRKVLGGTVNDSIAPTYTASDESDLSPSTDIPPDGDEEIGGPWL